MNDRTAPIVVALGGNAISPIGEEGNITQQFRQTRETAALATLVQTGATLCITHGNGPQVGNAIRRVELSAHEVYPLDLGICVADLQGGMGYMIAQCLRNELLYRGLTRSASTIVTTVEVDQDDPAFANPTKPIGSFFDQEHAEKYRREYGWDMVEVPPNGFRRVVASPRPQRIVEIDLIRRLVQEGELLITTGGGGIPVVRDERGGRHGREAVIDKDLASALLAGQIGAGTLIIATAVAKVSLDFGQPMQRNLDRLTLDEAKAHLEAGQFPPGSMGPKIQAAIDFLEISEVEDPRVVICAIEDLAEALGGRAGTVICRS